LGVGQGALDFRKLLVGRETPQPGSIVDLILVAANVGVPACQPDPPTYRIKLIKQSLTIMTKLIVDNSRRATETNLSLSLKTHKSFSQEGGKIRSARAVELLALSQRLSPVDLIFRFPTPTSSKMLLINFRIS